MLRIRSLLLCGFTVFGLIAISGAGAHGSSGCTDSWASATSGLWGVAGNWTNGIPMSTDSVCIDAPGTYTVTIAPWSIGTADPNNNGGNVASLTLGGASGTQTLDIVGQGSTSNSNEQVSTVFLNTSQPSTISAHGSLILDSTDGGSTLPGNPSGGFAAVSGGAFTNAGRIVSEIQDRKNKLANYTDFEAPLTNQKGASVSDNSGLLELSTVVNDGAFSVSSAASLSVIPPQFAGAGSFTNDGAFVNKGTVTSGNGTTWTQSGGSVKGNEVTLQDGAKLVDAAGAAQFLMNYSSATLTGTIPAGQTVTVIGEPSNYQGNNYNGTTLGLGGTTVVNNGTIVLDAQGAASKSGGPAIINDGAIRNNGTITAEVNDPSWNIQYTAGLVNTRSGHLTISGGTFTDNGGTPVSNAGTVTVGPKAVYLLESASVFTNTPGGTVVLQVASPTSLGQFQLTAPCCAGPGSFTAGGTLLPSPVHGYAPNAKSELQLILLDGGKFAGSFKSVGNKFRADYSKETATPAFVGAFYGQAAAAKKK